MNVLQGKKLNSFTFFLWYLKELTFLVRNLVRRVLIKQGSKSPKRHVLNWSYKTSYFNWKERESIKYGDSILHVAIQFKTATFVYNYYKFFFFIQSY